MGVLDNIYHFIFSYKNNQENSDFDLKALKENIRIYRAKESEKSSIDQKNNEKHQTIDAAESSEIIRYVEWVPDSLNSHARRLKPDNGQSAGTLKVSNHLLLGVKMFLAEVPNIIKGYYDLDRNNCLNFSKDVQNAATKRGIRCGLVIMTFHRNPTGHALVAFETDYGLKFFEPQSANEEGVVVGRRYSASLLGVSDDDIITKAEIFWNDGVHTIMENGIEELS
ncbi:MAG: hypothetical protein ABSE07_09370 [Methanoregula sp.]|jgi:hypothetical protein